MPSQDSLADQMRRTLTRAIAAGDYDAADWISNSWNRTTDSPITRLPDYDPPPTPKQPPRPSEAEAEAKSCA